MAEEPGVGLLHEVNDAEAAAVIEYCSHAIPHNEMVGRVLRNMYKRIVTLEAEVKTLKAKKPKAKGRGP